MKVIVCGAGQVGASIAQQLSSENNDVTVIDRSAETIHRINETMDVQALQGHAAFPDVLERAGIAGADMIIAVTQNDEVNMIACQVAHSLFGVPVKVARVRSQNYLDPAWGNLFSRDHLPIDLIISPEMEVARSVVRRLHVPGASEMISFVDDRVRVVGVALGEECPLVDTPLRQLTALFPDLHIRIMAIMRGETLMVPTADDQMLIGDEVFFAVDTQHLVRSMDAFGHNEKESRRVVIIGGGNIGLFIARLMQEEFSSLNLKIIERQKERAEYVADQLTGVDVLQGDSLSGEILAEANVQMAEAVIAVTNDDQVNVLSALLAKRKGAKHAMPLVNNASYAPLMRSLGIDAVINPRSITVSRILQQVRKGRIRGVHSLRDGAAEIVEAEALETSPLVGVPLRDVDLPDGIVLGAIARGSEIFIPRGDTVIEAGDRIVAITRRETIKKMEKLFAVRLGFF
jgi:trk system potassium uptake protein